MDSLQIAANPFAFMMDPAAVMAAVERSGRLATLKSRICRPLDKPLVGHAREEVEEFDGAIDDAIDESAEDLSA